MNKLLIIKEIWRFFRVRKKWWLIPIIVFLIIFGVFIIISANSSIAPFIYALF